MKKVSTIYILYMATNLFNGKRYIGYSEKLLHVRRGQHFSAASNPKTATCRIFHAAIRKYGKDAFEWQVIDTRPTKEEALAREIELISIVNPEYNISRGGQSGSNGVPWTEARKAAFSEVMRGRTMSPEARERWRKTYAEHGYGKPVMCLDDGLVFKSAAAASRYYKCSSSAITSVCNGKKGSVSVGGRYFAPAGLFQTEDARQQRVIELKALTHERRSAAGKARPPLDDIARKKIGSVSRGNTYRLGQSHTQETKDKLRKLGIENTEKFLQYRHLGVEKSSKVVICLNDGEKYPSASAAARHYNIQKSMVIELCLRNPRRRTAAGLVFRYEGDHWGGRAEALAEIEKSKSSRGIGAKKLQKSVICISDGQYYACAADASVAYKIHKSHIGEVCRGEKPAAHGLKFKYAE